EDDLARVIDLLEEPGRQPGQEATGQPGEDRRPREKRRAAELIGVRRPGQPSRQGPLEHGAHYSRRRCATKPPWFARPRAHALRSRGGTDHGPASGSPLRSPATGGFMIWGMSESTFTQLHVVLSLVGIASGLLALCGLVADKRLEAPFVIAQLLVLLLVAVLTILALKRFRA